MDLSWLAREKEEAGRVDESRNWAGRLEPANTVSPLLCVVVTRGRQGCVHLDWLAPTDSFGLGVALLGNKGIPKKERERKLDRVTMNGWRGSRRDNLGNRFRPASACGVAVRLC